MRELAHELELELAQTLLGHIMRLCFRDVWKFPLDGFDLSQKELLQTLGPRCFLFNVAGIRSQLLLLHDWVIVRGLH